MLRQKLSKEERKTRSHRLIVWGAVFESIVPEAKDMTDEEAAALLRLALTSEPAREFLKKTSRKRERRINPLGTKGALIHPKGRVRSAEGLSPHRELSPRYDWRLCRRQRKLLCGSHLHSRCVPTSGIAGVGEYKKRRSRQLRLKPTRCMKKASVLNSLSNAVRTLALVRMKGFEPTLF